MTLQPFVHAIVETGVILLVATGFQCVFRVGKFFHFAHGALFAAAPYLMFLGITSFQFPRLLSGLVAIAATVLMGLLIEFFLYRPIRRVGNSANVLLLCSLGIFVALESSIALFFGSAPKTLRSVPVIEGVNLLGARVTISQIAIVFSAVMIVLGMWTFSRVTSIGTKMEAVADDCNLANIIGISVERVYLVSIALASAIAAIGGIVVSFDVDMTPLMGLRPLMLGVVAVLVGGNSLFGTLWGASIIGATQHIGTIWVSSKWQDAIVFGTLLFALVF